MIYYRRNEKHRWLTGWHRLVFETSPDDEYRVSSYEVWKAGLFWRGRITYYPSWRERSSLRWNFSGLSRKAVRSKIARKLWKLRKADIRYHASREVK